MTSATRIPTLLTLALIATSAHAADFPKANNTLPLNNPASWVNNSPPQFSSDNALWNNIVTSPNTVVLGDNLFWNALRITNPGGDVTVNADGHTLTLFSGIDMSAATRNLTLNNILAFQNISAPASQVLNIAAGTTLTLNGVILPTSPGIAKLGPGTLLLGNGGVITPVPGQFDSTVYTLGISDGAVKLTSSNALNNTRLQLNMGHSPGAASTFDLNGNNATLSAIVTGSAPDPALLITNTSLTSATLTLRGPFLNSLNSDWHGVISNGTGGVSLFLDGSVHQFSGHNTFTGNLTLHHDQIINSFNEAAGITSNIFNPAAPLVLEGGEFNMRGTVSTFGSQTFASTTLNPGQSSIIQEINASLDLKAITRNPGSTLYIGAKGPGVFTSNPLTPSGILGGWAANAEFNVNVDNWLTRDIASPSAPMLPLLPSAYSTSFTVSSNTDMTTSLLAPANAITGSVRFNNPGSILTITGNTRIDSGGILITSNASISSLTTVSPADTLTSGNGQDLIVHQYANTPFTLNAVIADNAGAPIALTKAGSGTLILTRPNTYTGGTYLNNGIIVVVNGASLGTGPITLSRYPYAASGTQLVLGDGVTLSNNLVADFNSSTIAEPPFLNVPSGNDTFTGSITVHQNDKYLVGTLASSGTGGILTLTGAGTSGDPGPNTQINTTVLRGNVIFAANGSLTSYQTPIRYITFGGPGIASSLTLKDNASLTVLNVQPPKAFGPSSGLGFDTGAQTLSNGFTFTLQDNASLNLGPLDLELNNTNNANSISSTSFHLNGGIITVGRIIMTANFPTETSTLTFNGTTLFAGKDTTSFLDNKIPQGTRTLFANISTGGARINTNSHAITINADLLHDPTLGTAPDGGLTKLGPGTLTLTGTAHSFTGPLSIQQDTVALNTPVALKINALTIAQVGGALNGGIDLVNSPLIVQSSSPGDKSAKITSLNTALAAGSAPGGKGITSSTAATDSSHFAVSLFDNADLHLTSFGSQPVDNNSLLLTLAPRGDANFDKKVDAFDLNILAAHWQQQSGATASSGDFTHDAKVDAFDLNALAANWQFGGAIEGSLESALAQLPIANSPIPEPASLLLLIPAALLVPCRRRSQ